MNNLKIYYTIPFFIPEQDQESYATYMDFAEIAKRDDLPFEMISFQDSPGRFLTDKIVFEKMSELGDFAFPITVLKDEIVKISALPTADEFSNWFESLEIISFDRLYEEASQIEHYVFPSQDDLSNFDCSQNCFSCNSEACALINLDE